MDEFINLQLFLALTMFLTTIIAGLAPIKLLTSIKRNKEGNKTSSFLSLLSCFAGGVFLATCFLDLQPHVNMKFRKFNEQWNLKIKYPLPDLLVCIGFFAVYLLEEIFVRLFSTINNTVKIDKKDMVGECDTIRKSTECEQILTTSDKFTENGGSSEQIKSKRCSLEINKGKEVGILQSITFTVAMSFHSILEGIALGVQDDKAGILTLFFSLFIHKGIESFTVGLQISKSNPEKIKMVTIIAIIYSFMTPMGSLAGVFIRYTNMDAQYKEGLIISLSALAAGTFIYVTFFEVIATERVNEYSNLAQLAAIIAGFSTVAAFQLIEIIID